MADFRNQVEAQLGPDHQEKSTLDEVTHEILIHSFQGDFILEEVDPEGTMCLVHRSDLQYLAEGTTRFVVAKATGLDEDDPWVSAVVLALERERGWKRSGSGWGRRTQLEVRRGHGSMYHVTACANRDSIRQHGLDWRLMGAAPGVAGSTNPELPGIFLQEHADDDFFVQMSRTTTDMWEVNVNALWLESGPSGWWVVTSPIGPERLRLLPPRYPATDR
jgi:hypothetical protein